MKKVFFYLLIFLLLLSPVYSCSGHEPGKDSIGNITSDDDNVESKEHNKKKKKGKKHKNYNNNEEDPESFIRGDIPEREPVLELD